MSLGVTFFAVLLLSILLLFTLPLMKKWFQPIEIFILFMFTSYFCQNMFYTLSSPYDRISVVEEHFPFWTVRFQYGVVFSITLLWLMVVYRTEWSLVRKLAFTFAWIIFGIVVEKIYLQIGVLRSDSISWYPSVDLFFSMIVVLLTLAFTNFLGSLLRKENIL
ncbi:hypothetical protein LCM10_08155 [Rossellomorea aquimaris]|uniref:hypothetical protein n=1 Tax=Rossellomorea aquimaris TaxID=189382 RepID=UPI001CD4BBED|nr:hypothetical protein [Rossellomorea aquimaris]MCA1054954.1 hypothetical protein [Rossellomorea aquimaris]